MENIKINDRLLTAVPFVRNDRILCDVGTDHAYLPIYLINVGKITNAIAADINRGPLDKAKENIEKYNLNNQIKTVLCDGLSKIEPNEVDDITIFGMGGELIVKIIDEAQWLRNSEKRIIMQPMTHPEKLRLYLFENGFHILGEAISLDRGKIYQTICAQYDGKIRKVDDFALLYGEHLLQENDELIKELMRADKRKLERKIQGKSAGNEDFSFEKALLESIDKYIER